MTWILILYVHAAAVSMGLPNGATATPIGGPVAVTSVPGFKTENECGGAGMEARVAFKPAVVEFVCVYQGK